MKDYFEEKTSQVEPSSLTAFGIEISSRYGNSFELIEMMNFCKALALKKIAHYVTSIFYDSKATIPTIETIDGVKTGDPIEAQIREIGLSHFVQFQLLDEHCIEEPIL